MNEYKISCVMHAILYLELDVHVATATSMHHCKTCGSTVCDSRERRLFDKPTSASVRQELNNFVGTLALGESFSRFNDEHFSDGYLCKKCFVLVVKRSHIKSELEKVDATIKSNMSTAGSVFDFHD